MNLDAKQKKFLKDNKEILTEIFIIRLDELVDTAAELNSLDEGFSQKAAINLLFIREFKDWIKYIEILSKSPKKEKTTNKDYI